MTMTRREVVLGALVGSVAASSDEIMRLFPATAPGEILYFEAWYCRPRGTWTRIRATLERNGAGAPLEVEYGDEWRRLVGATARIREDGAVLLDLHEDGWSLLRGATWRSD